MPVEPAALTELSVYVHIPFCTSRCRYCDFYVETGASPGLIDRMLTRITEEASWYSRRTGRPQIRTIYLGGGTPSVVAPARLERFLRELAASLAAEAVDEWTIEANPESLTGDFLAAAQAAGVGRLSLGVQSFQDHLLERLGRRARRAAVDAALETVAREWRGRLTVDLITGTPSQTWDDLERDLQCIASARPGHVSLYSLTVEPGTPLARQIERGRVVPLDDEVQEQLWIAARDALQAQGYRWYEVSNFALPGNESVHNPVYWRSEPYLGLGPGAVGTLPSGAPVRPVRVTNPQLPGYLEADYELRRELEVIDDRTLLFEHFMLGLRTAAGIRLGRLEAVFGTDAESISTLLGRCEQLWSYVDRDLLARGRIALSPEGRLRANGLLVSLAGEIDRFTLPRRARWPAADRLR